MTEPRPGWDDRFSGTPYDEEPEPQDIDEQIDEAYELNEALKEKS